MPHLSFSDPFYEIIEEGIGFTGREVPPTGRNLSPRQGGAIRSLRPKMDLHEDAEKNIVTATFEFPGLTKEDVNIEVHYGKLTVSAETRKSSNVYDEHGYAVRERQYGKFSRILQLPQGVQEGEIKASMNDGVLTITFPKSTPEFASKKITIS